MVNNKFEYLNLYLERIKPFSDPINEEIITAGSTITIEFVKLPFNACQACSIPVVVQVVGSCHIVDASAWALDLNEALKTT